MGQLNLFGGHGFIGSKYFNDYLYGDSIIRNDKYDYTVRSDKILYFLSTVSNYNVLVNAHIDIDTNLSTLMTVLEQCRNKNVEFNFISSWFVYGDTDELPAREDANCNPKGFYSITKRTAEQLLISYAKTFDIKYRILRLANVIGKSDNKVSKQKNAIQWMINEIKANRDVYVYDDGKIIRDFIYIDDVLAGIDKVIHVGEINSIYNVGVGLCVYVQDILQYAKSQCGSSSKLYSVPIPDFHKIVQVKDMYMDTTKIRQLGFQPKYNVKAMVDELLK